MEENQQKLVLYKEKGPWMIKEYNLFMYLHNQYMVIPNPIILFPSCQEDIRIWD